MVNRIAGYAFVVAGLAGLALPILPGIPLLIIGVRLLGPGHPVTRRLVGLIRPRENNKD